MPTPHSLLHRCFLRRAPAGLLTLMLALARATHAQSDLVVNPHMLDSGSCVASIPDSAFAPTVVYLTAAVRNPIPQHVPAEIANVMQTVVNRVDSVFGGVPPYLPNGEPRVHWHDIGGGLLLTWHRDGRLTWTVDADSGGPPRDTSSLAHIFARSLAATIAAGDAFLAWPPDAANDSVQSDVGFSRAPVKPDKKLEPVQAVLAIPLLAVRAPWQTTVRVARMTHPTYPMQLQQLGAQGTVIVQFVVDTTGRADTTTIHDAWPAWRPRLTGEYGRYYDQFYSRATRAIARGRFVPATIAGCKVREVVEQPFTWQIGP